MSPTCLRASLIYLVLSAGVAAAQVSLEPLALTTSDGLSTYRFGASGCTTMLQATWTSTSLFGTPCGDMTVWTTTGECGDAAAGTDHSLDSVPSTLVLSVRTGVIVVDLSQLPGFDTTDGGVVCGAAGTSVTMKLCAAIALQNGFTCISNHAAPLEIDYDTEAPTIPSIDSVVAKDGALAVTVSFSSDTQYVQVEAEGPSDQAFGHAIQIYVADTSTGKVAGLVNDTPYQLRAFAVDAAGNVSGDSAVVTATPLHTVGFWEAYRRAGGEAQGCSVAGRGLWPLLMVVLAARRRQG